MRKTQERKKRRRKITVTKFPHTNEQTTFSMIYFVAMVLDDAKQQ